MNNFLFLGESAETLLSIKNGGYPSIDEIKTEVIDDDTMDMDDQQISNNSTDSHMDTEESDPIPELGPAALGLQRVGTQPPPKPNPPSQPVQVLNRRGMPARIRKKNKLFYDDILVNHPHHRYIFYIINMYINIIHILIKVIYFIGSKRIRRIQMQNILLKKYLDLLLQKNKLK